MGLKSEESRHDSFDDKMDENSHSPKKSKIRQVPVSTTDRQSMAYVTVRNIESATSHLQVNWPIFVLKELEGNAYDWLNDNYKAKNSEDKEFRKIAVRIWIATNNEFKNVSLDYFGGYVIGYRNVFLQYCFRFSVSTIITDVNMYVTNFSNRLSTLTRCCCFSSWSKISFITISAQFQIVCHQNTYKYCHIKLDTEKTHGTKA